MIPKVMNFFWGNGPHMSFMRWLTLRSFRSCNPNWDIILHEPPAPCPSKTWTTHEEDDFGFNGENYYDHINDLRIERRSWTPPGPRMSAAHASDFFTWSLLSSQGGYYSDMDVLYVNSMDRVTDGVNDGDAMFCLQNDGMAIGFLAACPECPIFADVNRAAAKHFTNNGYQCAGTQAVYNAFKVVVTKSNGGYSGKLALNAMRRMYPQLRVVSIDGDSIYHYDWLTYVKMYDSSHVENVLPNHVGYHWFGGAPISQGWNRRLTASSIRKFNNAFCRLAARYV